MGDAQSALDGRVNTGVQPASTFLLATVRAWNYKHSEEAMKGYILFEPSAKLVARS